MSKRSPGSKASQAKGEKTHKEQRERHRQKMRRKYDAYCREIEKDATPGVSPAPYDQWLKWFKATTPKPGDSLTTLLTDSLNDLGIEAKEKK